MKRVLLIVVAAVIVAAMALCGLTNARAWITIRALQALSGASDKVVHATSRYLKWPTD